ncbi:MAG: NAD-dependent epimerase/dehydratase family protein [Bacteroidetes bacterium]|nr:MAG: NAD-dependent epimerase/dehydratase family protein [Bacteroidota bacterium]
MQQKISILGCGWLGSALATELIRSGYEVAGSTTSLEKMSDLSEAGIKPFLIDISSIDSTIQNFLSAEILIVAITSKNIEHFVDLIECLEASQVQKVLFISSTSVYPNTNEVVTESTNTLLSPLVEIEQLFTSNPSFHSTILRFGGLFGYDRKPGNFVRSKKRIPNPEGYINFIHRDDCIAIIGEIIKQNAWDEIFNACSDSHPKRRDFYRKEARKIGLDSIEFDEDSKNEFKIVNSEKLKAHLGYSFKYSDLME